jgi:hypothetical protein
MTEKYSGTIDGAHSFLPEFDKVAPESFNLGKNANLDLVVRRPGSQTAEPAPVLVGMVSKTYRIIQHREVLRAALSFTQQAPDSQTTNVKIHATENWERIMVELMFGSAYAMSPDGHDVGLRLVCRNSVDGTSAVRSLLGWFRLVCSNGMVVGVTLGKTRLAHKPGADLGALFAPLKDQLAVVEKERTTLADWTSTRVSQSKLRAWVDGPVAKQWNSLSAARVWHITQTGLDARFVPPFQRATPSKRKVELLDAVPGTPNRAETVYDVAQALSYAASRRRDVEEAFQRSIGSLLAHIHKN